MTTRRRWAGFAIALLGAGWVAGCAKDPDDGGSAADLPCGAPAGDWKYVLSCDSQFSGLVHQCIDYYATASAVSAVETSFKSICQVQQGTLLSGVCPTEGSNGSCTATASSGSSAAVLERQYFYESNTSPASYKASCESDKGIYTPPEGSAVAPTSSGDPKCSQPAKAGGAAGGVAFSISTVLNGDVIECTNYVGEVSAAELDSVLKQGAETTPCPVEKAVCACPADGVFGTKATLVYYQTFMSSSKDCPNDDAACGPYSGP
ncbi:MAG TPA: hypothetical protein VEQ58_06585 [Polyangiaceae bacterium]|nr:hypothetical protein [Polyangiaceae bacterium]